MKSFGMCIFLSPKAFNQFLHLATLSRSDIDLLLLPPGGWDSGVVVTPSSPMCSLTLTGNVPASQLPCVLADWGTLPGPGGVCRAANSFVCWPPGKLSGPNLLTLPVRLPLGIEIFVKSMAYTALGMGDCALAPRPVRATDRSWERQVRSWSRFLQAHGSCSWLLGYVVSRPLSFSWPLAVSVQELRICRLSSGCSTACFEAVDSRLPILGLLTYMYYSSNYIHGIFM